MDIEREFARFARSQRGVSSMALTDYTATVRSAYINPQIIEERQLNAVAMDVFSRLMMDRIIILGVPIDDDVANIIMAQLLFLESVDASKDIQMYINSPGGGVYAGLAIYDTMQLLHADVATICTGMAASMAAVLMAAGTKGKRSALPHSRLMIHQKFSRCIRANRTKGLRRTAIGITISPRCRPKSTVLLTACWSTTKERERPIGSGVRPARGGLRLARL